MMARKQRIDVAGEFYHCMNRANARLKINFERKDYLLFLKTLKEAQEIFETYILAFVIMNNHFHLVICTRLNQEMGRFMKWLTLTYTQRWHKKHETVGYGHLFQGRYKSVLIKDQLQLETVLRYVERNPLTANLVSNILNWEYSSLYQRHKRVIDENKIILAKWPFKEPKDYLKNLIEPLTKKEEEKMNVYE
jgi:putative transposase